MPTSPIKLAIVGGGPSSFYVASRLLSLLPFAHSTSESPKLHVHVYDRLWAPHGLVRYGVAPDHPEVKNCTHKFDQAGADPRFRFFGNVNIGIKPNTPNILPHALNIPLSSILPHYTHLLFATGCTEATLHPSLPPTQNKCVTALSLVHWYTQHPSNPPPPPLHETEHVTLIGQGNVSLDIARILLTPPSTLEKYDVPKVVLDVLEKSKVKHVSIVGRRGPWDVAFTAKELREMFAIPGVGFQPLAPALLEEQGRTPTRQQKRIIDLMKTGPKQSLTSEPQTKSWSLDFFKMPQGMTVSDNNISLQLQHTTVDPLTKRAVPSNITSTLNTDLIVTSLGFHADPYSSLPSASGRVLSPDGHPLRNIYTSGWASMGAKGVLATTMMDAYAIADTIISDTLSPAGSTFTTTPYPPESSPTPSSTLMALSAKPEHPSLPPPAVVEGLKNGQVISYQDWKRIDEEEVRRGVAKEKERERMDWEGARNFLDRQA